MNLEDVMLSEISQSQEDKYCYDFLVDEVSTLSGHIHRAREWNGGCQGLVGGGMGSGCFKSTEFWFCKVRRVPEVDGW